jgi:hypothetical protein
MIFQRRPHADQPRLLFAARQRGDNSGSARRTQRLTYKGAKHQALIASSTSCRSRDPPSGSTGLN